MSWKIMMFSIHICIGTLCQLAHSIGIGIRCKWYLIILGLVFKYSKKNYWYFGKLVMKISFLYSIRTNLFYPEIQMLLFQQKSYLKFSLGYIIIWLMLSKIIKTKLIRLKSNNCNFHRCTLGRVAHLENFLKLFKT